MAATSTESGLAHTADTYPPAEHSARKTEGEGFEPSSEENPLKRFSRPPHSTALPPLRDAAPTG
jgi:hypothetical protein